MERGDNEHKKLYKHKTDTVDDIKNKRRQQDVSLRKEKREKIISSKRYRFAETDHETEYTVEDVVDTIKKLQHGSTDKLADLKKVRQACAQGTLYIDALLKLDNSLQCIVGLLTGNDVELQQEAAWCLTNISAGLPEHAMAVIKLAAPYLITYLSSSNYHLQDQCAWALGNIAGDGPECRDCLHKQGIVSPIVKLLQSPVPAVVQSSAFAISNMARDSQDIARDLVGAGVIQSLPQFLNMKPDNRPCLTEVSWILTYLTTSGEHVPLLIEAGILPVVVSLLVHLAEEEKHDAQAMTPLLRCLGNICSGPDEYLQIAMENPRLLNMLGRCLESEIRHITKETLWVFSNVAGDSSIAKAIVYSPLLEKVTEKLTAGFDIKQEALFVLNNLASHGPEACDRMLEHKVVQALVPILKSHDVEVLDLCLMLSEQILRNTEAGNNVFEQAGGVARLEGLEYHSNEAVASKAHKLLDTYFLIDKEEAEDT